MVHIKWASPIIPAVHYLVILGVKRQNSSGCEIKYGYRTQFLHGQMNADETSFQCS